MTAIFPGGDELIKGVVGLKRRLSKYQKYMDANEQNFQRYL